MSDTEHDDHPDDEVSFLLRDPNQPVIVTKALGLSGPYFVAELSQEASGAVKIDLEAGGGILSVAELVDWLRTICDALEENA
jgi:hypothetical protein